MSNLAKPTGAREMTIAQVERFARRFTVQPDGCWQWRGYITREGYGQYGVHGVGKRAHRIMWELVGRPFDPTKQLDHLCRNRACVSPYHLEEVTARVNTRRGVSPAAVNAQKDVCLRGHPLTGDNLKLRQHVRGGILRRCWECERMFSRQHKRRVFGFKPLKRFASELEQANNSEGGDRE